MNGTWGVTLSKAFHLLTGSSSLCSHTRPSTSQAQLGAGLGELGGWMGEGLPSHTHAPRRVGPTSSIWSAITSGPCHVLSLQS